MLRRGNCAALLREPVDHPWTMMDQWHGRVPEWAAVATWWRRRSPKPLRYQGERVKKELTARAEGETGGLLGTTIQSADLASTPRPS